VDQESQESITTPFPDAVDRTLAGGVSRRRALGVAGAGVAGALLPAAHAEADTGAGIGASKNSATTLTAARIAVIAALARTMAAVPVALPYRVGKDQHPLDRVTDTHIRTLAGHMTSSQLALACQGADMLAAAGIGSARPPAIASAVAARTDWDESPEVGAALLLATATATPLGFCATFPPAWRGLLRTRSWPAITTTATQGEAQ
jgi:hypothetical protein